MEIILASGSPRRKQLMEMLGVPNLSIIAPQREEEKLPGRGPEETVLALASAKAEEIAQAHPQALVVAADTIVWQDGRILGKPRDEGEAFSMLSALSGREHEVYSGLCLRLGDKVLAEAEETRVRFRPLTEREIRAYIATGEPMDKAGAYGAQGLGSLFVEGIEGDFFNVMGLPVCRLGLLLRQFGVELL